METDKKGFPSLTTNCGGRGEQEAHFLGTTAAARPVRVFTRWSSGEPIIDSVDDKNDRAWVHLFMFGCER